MNINDYSIIYKSSSVKFELLENFVQSLEPEFYVPVEHDDHVLVSLEP